MSKQEQFSPITADEMESMVSDVMSGKELEEFVGRYRSFLQESSASTLFDPEEAVGKQGEKFHQLLESLSFSSYDSASAEKKKAIIKQIDYFIGKFTKTEPQDLSQETPTQRKERLRKLIGSSPAIQEAFDKFQTLSSEKKLEFLMAATQEKMKSIEIPKQYEQRIEQLSLVVNALESFVTMQKEKRGLYNKIRMGFKGDREGKKVFLRGLGMTDQEIEEHDIYKEEYEYETVEKQIDYLNSVGIAEIMKGKTIDDILNSPSAPLAKMTVAYSSKEMSISAVLKLVSPNGGKDFFDAFGFKMLDFGSIDYKGNRESFNKGLMLLYRETKDRHSAELLLEQAFSKQYKMGKEKMSKTKEAKIAEKAARYVDEYISEDQIIKWKIEISKQLAKNGQRMNPEEIDSLVRRKKMDMIEATKETITRQHILKEYFEGWVPDEKTAGFSQDQVDMWKEYTEMVNLHDSLNPLDWSDAAWDRIMEELVISLPLIVASGGVASLALRALSSGTRTAILSGRLGNWTKVGIKATSDGKALMAISKGEKASRAGSAILGAGKLVRAASFPVFFEMSHKGFQGEWMFDQEDWVNDLLFTTAALGMFSGAKLLGKGLNSVLVESWITKLAPKYGKNFANITRWAFSINAEAGMILLLNRLYRADKGLFEELTEEGFAMEVFHAYVTAAGLSAYGGLLENSKPKPPTKPELSKGGKSVDKHGKKSDTGELAPWMKEFKELPMSERLKVFDRAPESPRAQRDAPAESPAKDYNLSGKPDALTLPKVLRKGREGVRASLLALLALGGSQVVGAVRSSAEVSPPPRPAVPTKVTGVSERVSPNDPFYLPPSSFLPVATGKSKVVMVSSEVKPEAMRVEGGKVRFDKSVREAPKEAQALLGKKPAEVFEGIRSLGTPEAVALADHYEEEFNKMPEELRKFISIGLSENEGGDLIPNFVIDQEGFVNYIESNPDVLLAWLKSAGILAEDFNPDDITPERFANMLMMSAAGDVDLGILRQEPKYALIFDNLLLPDILIPPFWWGVLADIIILVFLGTPALKIYSIFRRRRSESDPKLTPDKVVNDAYSNAIKTGRTPEEASVIAKEALKLHKETLGPGLIERGGGKVKKKKDELTEKWESIDKNKRKDLVIIAAVLTALGLGGYFIWDWIEEAIKEANIAEQAKIKGGATGTPPLLPNVDPGREAVNPFRSEASDPSTPKVDAPEEAAPKVDAPEDGDSWDTTGMKDDSSI